MTRGNIVIIAPNGTVFSSVQFNGDMDIEGHGKEVVNLLKSVRMYPDFEKAVSTFNEKNFEYENGSEIHEAGPAEECFRPMNEEYYKEWNSDYLYIKNISGKTVNIKMTDDHVTAVIPGEISVFNFGKCVYRIFPAGYENEVDGEYVNPYSLAIERREKIYKAYLEIRRAASSIISIKELDESLIQYGREDCEREKLEAREAIEKMEKALVLMRQAVLELEKI